MRNCLKINWNFKQNRFSRFVFFFLGLVFEKEEERITKQEEERYVKFKNKNVCVFNAR